MSARRLQRAWAGRALLSRWVEVQPSKGTGERAAAQFAGKTVVVTGGGRGIGRGITETFLVEGARAAVLQRSEPDANLTCRDDVMYLPLDMTDASGLSAAADAVTAEFGGIDILVNNAGTMIEHDLDSLTIEDWGRMMAINVKAPVFMAQAVFPHMKRRGAGASSSLDRSRARQRTRATSYTAHTAHPRLLFTA